VSELLVILSVPAAITVMALAFVVTVGTVSEVKPARAETHRIRRS
jgi:hypothetical protein